MVAGTGTSRGEYGTYLLVPQCDSHDGCRKRWHPPGWGATSCAGWQPRAVAREQCTQGMQSIDGSESVCARLCLAAGGAASSFVFTWSTAGVAATCAAGARARTPSPPGPSAGGGLAGARPLKTSSLLRGLPRSSTLLHPRHQRPRSPFLTSIHATSQ